MNTFGSSLLFILVLPFHGASAFARAADVEPIPTDAHEKAAYYIRAGKMDEAIAIYQGLVNQDPKNIERRKELMWALWHANRYQETASAAP